MFKTIQQDFGVTVDLGNYMFIFSDKSHTLTDLGSSKVRITRKIDGLHEIFNADISSFTDLNGDAVAANFAELDAYLKTNAGGATPGIGLSKSGSTLNLKPASTTELGGVKVGAGLAINGDNELTATAVSEETQTVGSEAAMLALPLSAGGYRVNRTDLERLYYLNSGEDPAILANWIQGPSTALAVLTFNGRNGAVMPEKGDYKASMIRLPDETTATNYYLVVDNGELYLDDGYDALDANGDTV